METLWQEAIKALREILRIYYYNPDAPIDLIKDCFIEERDNLQIRFEPIVKSKQALIQHFSPAEIIDTPDNEAKLAVFFENKIEGYKKQLNEFMDTYISIADSFNLDDLTTCSGDLVFVFPNKSVKSLFHNEIYKELQDFREIIKEKVYCFRLVKKGERNMSECLRALQELNDYFFRIAGTYIYRDKYDTLDDSIEKFRAKIYHIEPELKEHMPIDQLRSAKRHSPQAEP
jgi:hypothetical protein